MTVSIYDDATVILPLTNSLIMGKGTGNPTFSRASAATVFDNEGKLITVPAGVARFQGARAVCNLLETTEADLSGWGLSRCTKAAGPDPFGGSQGTVVTVSSSSSYTLLHNTTPITHDTLYRRLVLNFKYINWPWWFLSLWNNSPVDRARLWFNSQTGELGSNIDLGNFSTTRTEIRPHPSGATGWYQVILDTFSTADSIGSGGFYVLSCAPGDGLQGGTPIGSELNIYAPELLGIGGNTTTTKQEYISSGVESAPYHGAGADGSQWFNTDSEGVLIPDSVLKGYLGEESATNLVLYCRDFTNAAWVKTNIDAALDQTGVDGIVVIDTASSLTATAANGTCFQTITLAAASRTFSVYVKRIEGTGVVEITRDGGSTYTDITSLINDSTYTRVAIRGTSVLNPAVGFRIVTLGDAIAVDYAQDETGGEETSPIYTATTSATRAADSLTYQTASNFSDTAGGIYARFTNLNWSIATGYIGSATTGLHRITTNSGVSALDGTNTVNGPTGTPDAGEDLGIFWQSSDLKAAANGTLATAGTYDGSFGLSNIAVQPNCAVRDLYIWTAAVSDTDITALTAAAGDLNARTLALTGIGR